MSKNLPDASEFIEAVKKLADDYDVELVRCTATDKNGTSSFTRTGKGQNQTMPRNPEAKYAVHKTDRDGGCVQVTTPKSFNEAQLDLDYSRRCYPGNRYIVKEVSYGK